MPQFFLWSKFVFNFRLDMGASECKVRLPTPQLENFSAIRIEDSADIPKIQYAVGREQSTEPLNLR